MTFLETYRKIITETPDTTYFKGNTFKYGNTDNHSFFLNDEVFVVSKDHSRRIEHNELKEYLEFLANETAYELDAEGDNRATRMYQRTRSLAISNVLYYPHDEEVLKDNYFNLVMNDDTQGRIFELPSFLADDMHICSIWGEDEEVLHRVKSSTFKLMLEALKLTPRQLYIEFENWGRDYEGAIIDEKGDNVLILYSDLDNVKDDTRGRDDEEQHIADLLRKMHTTSDPLEKAKIERELKDLGAIRGDDEELPERKIKDPLYWHQNSRMSESVKY